MINFDMWYLINQKRAYSLELTVVTAVTYPWPSHEAKVVWIKYVLAGFPLFPAIWIFRRGTFNLYNANLFISIQDQKDRKFDPNGYKEVDLNVPLGAYILYPDTYNVSVLPEIFVKLFSVLSYQKFRRNRWIVCVKLHQAFMYQVARLL